LTEKDLSSRYGVKNKDLLNSNKAAITKVIVHLAWLKDFSRSFCEADEIAFYLICGKWGKPTKSNAKVNWAGEVLSSSMGLQATLEHEDVFYPFLDQFSLLS
jgi:hypothetical protein